MLHVIGSTIAFGSMAVSIVLQAAISLHARRALGRRGIVAMVQAAMAVISWGLIFPCEEWERSSRGWWEGQ